MFNQMLNIYLKSTKNLKKKNIRKQGSDLRDFYESFN